MAPFRVLQFNMQFGQGWRDNDPDNAKIDLEASIAEIRRHDADLVMLQEVEQVQPGGEQREPPPNYSRLREALPGYSGYFAYPAADERELPFGIGLAILSRTPLRDPVRVDLPSPPVEFEFHGRRTTPTDRLLIGSRTTLAGRDLTILNTHLLAFFMLKTSSEVHGGQRSQVADILRGTEGPVILTGDFNVSRHDSLVDQFGAIGFRTVQDTEVTWRRRPYVLDHIFHNEALRCVGHSVIPTPASDHHVLVADFVFAD